jgi:hypothetical protein
MREFVVQDAPTELIVAARRVEAGTHDVDSFEEALSECDYPGVREFLLAKDRQGATLFPLVIDGDVYVHLE